MILNRKKHASHHTQQPASTLTSHDTKMSLPASATIPPPAAIYESDTPSQDTEVSDVSIDNDNDDTSDNYEDEGSGDDGSDGEETEDAAFHRAAREIMNRAGRTASASAHSLGRSLKSSAWYGTCWGRVAFAPRRASQSICSGRYIF